MFEAELYEVRERVREAYRYAPVRGELARIVAETVTNPGKMVRPKVMLMVAGDYPSDTRDELLCSAAAIEASHTASLVLDDMVDGAAMRRGAPTVYANNGADVALYVGLSILMGAQEYVLERGYARTAEAIAHTVQVMCDGEMLQHDSRRNVDVEEKALLAAIRGKTASLFERACTLACQITRKDEAYTSAMARLGECLGIMFQIRDDLLDWTASEEQAGKPVNEDFASGIYTLPAVYALSQEGYGDRLRALAQKPTLSAEDLVTARELVLEAGGIAYAHEILGGLAADARTCIDAHLGGIYAEGLRVLVDLLEGRA